MNLEEIEQALQARIDYMAKMDESPFEDWLRVYEVLAQVKQAQCLETISITLDGMGKDMSAVTLSDPWVSHQEQDEPFVGTEMQDDAPWLSRDF